jgi:hypothetical protein
MKPTIRIPLSLERAIRTDLARPHAFAAERVGFLFCAANDLGSARPLVLARDYVPVGEEEYVRDRRVGARIDANAIRGARQRVLERQEVAFHVHAHIGRGMPRLSRTDIAELPAVVQSLCITAPALPHGLLLLSEDSMAALMWMPGLSSAVAGEVVVVGLPMQHFVGEA